MGDALQVRSGDDVVHVCVEHKLRVRPAHRVVHVVLELADGAAGAAVAQPLEERLERLRRVGHVAKPEARAGVGGMMLCSKSPS